MNSISQHNKFNDEMYICFKNQFFIFEDCIDSNDGIIFNLVDQTCLMGI